MLVARGHHVTVIASPVSYITGAPVASGKWIGRERRSVGTEDPAGLGICGTPSILRASHAGVLFIHAVILLAGIGRSRSGSCLGHIATDLPGRHRLDPGSPEGRPLSVRGPRSLARVRGRGRRPEESDPDSHVGVARAHAVPPRRLIVVNSPGFVDHVRLRGARRIELIPNGADPAMFDASASGATFRRENGLGDQFVALYAGAHGMSNDLEVSDGCRPTACRAKTPDRVRRRWQGKGRSDRTSSRSWTTSCSFHPLPRVACRRSWLPRMPASPSFGPIPAYATTYPNKVFDYMAAGRPVILAIDGVIRQVVEAAGCGVFAEPGDPAALARAIRKLASDRESARRMGLAGRKYLEQQLQSGADLADSSSRFSNLRSRIGEQHAGSH